MKSLLESFASTDPDEPAPLDALCKRLGITTSDPQILRWALVGMHLALAEPEFKGALKGRGRPRKSGWSKDDERAALIDLAQMNSPVSRTKTEWIELARRGEMFADGRFRDVQLRLFSRGNDYRASVSRGANVFAKR